jgi:dTDP-glucose 4,6-dehydratase
VNTNKIEALGYQPEIQFIDGLKDTIDWYTSNQGWWEP